MKTTIKYFGMVAERLNIESEDLTINTDSYPINLRKLFEQKYSELQGMRYQIAIDLEISDYLKEDQTPKEIALLPPFAGG